MKDSGSYANPINSSFQKCRTTSMGQCMAGPYGELRCWSDGFGVLVVCVGGAKCYFVCKAGFGIFVQSFVGITKSSIFCARPVLVVFLGPYPGDGAVGAFGKYSCDPVLLFFGPEFGWFATRLAEALVTERRWSFLWTRPLD